MLSPSTVPTESGSTTARFHLSVVSLSFRVGALPARLPSPTTNSTVKPPGLPAAMASTTGLFFSLVPRITTPSQVRIDLLPLFKVLRMWVNLILSSHTPTSSGCATTLKSLILSFWGYEYLLTKQKGNWLHDVSGRAPHMGTTNGVTENYFHSVVSVA